MDEVGQDDGGYLTGTATGRTALVADIIHQKVYLIVTNNSNKFITFCRAIEEYLDITPGVQRSVKLGVICLLADIHSRSFPA